MKHMLAFLVSLATAAAPLLASERVSTVGTARSEQSRLTVWGTTDFEEMRPVIEGFLQINPSLSVEYHDMLSHDLYEALHAGSAAPDLAISSAADLQVKLVNDGFAVAHQSSETAQLPTWANWRNQAFGITAEPAVIVYNSKLEVEGTLPRSRQDLIQFIREKAGILKGRLATYDVAASGVGYLFASHDSLYSSTFTTLMQSFGQTGIRLYCCTGEMLDALERGEVLIGYNLLGSYALSRKMRGSPIEIVMPEDYTLWLSRVALIPQGAAHPELGRLLLNYLLSAEGQARLGTQTMMRPLATPALNPMQIPGILSHANVQAQPIALNPSLLVFLDHLKQERFIRSWRALVAAEP